jgi:hypothetical protein
MKAAKLKKRLRKEIDILYKVQTLKEIGEEE